MDTAELFSKSSLNGYELSSEIITNIQKSKGLVGATVVKANGPMVKLAANKAVNVAMGSALPLVKKT